MTTPRRSAAELESRIAQLDERLRLARMSATRAPSAASSANNAPSLSRGNAAPETPLVREGSVERPGFSPAASRSARFAPDASRMNVNLSATVLEGSYTNNSISTPLYRDPASNEGYLNIQSPKPTSNGLNATATQEPAFSSKTDGDDTARRQVVSPVASYVSPWREHSLQAQVESAAYLEEESKRATERRLDALRSDVTKGSDEIHHKDMQLLWYAARKDTATADTHRYLQEASDKLEKIEDDEAKVKVATEEVNRSIQSLQQDLQSSRDAMMRAEKRSHELRVERQELQTQLKGVEAEMAERSNLDADFVRHSKEARLQLQARVSALSEEVDAAHQRLAAREAALSSTRVTSEQEIASLQDELAKYRDLQLQMEERNRSLSQQLRATKEELARAVDERRQKAALGERRRVEALEREVSRAKADTAHAARKTQEESAAALALLQEELVDYKTRLAASRRDNESLHEDIHAQDVLIEQMEGAVLSAEGVEAEFDANEAKVAALIHKRESIVSQTEMVNRDIAKNQDQVMLLEAEVNRLQDLNDEEGKLKRYIASISSEIAASSEMQAEENRQNAEKEAAMGEEHSRLLQEAAGLDSELQRVRATNATRLDALSRRLHSARSNMLDRERILDDLVAKNTQLQSTIIEYEESRRRMEREAMQKKEAATRAAKAALEDLQ